MNNYENCQLVKMLYSNLAVSILYFTYNYLQIMATLSINCCFNIFMSLFHSMALVPAQSLSDADRPGSSCMLLPTIEDFNIIKPISRGAYAKVYLGTKQNDPTKFYAIKVNLSINSLCFL